MVYNLQNVRPSNEYVFLNTKQISPPLNGWGSAETVNMDKIHP